MALTDAAKTGGAAAGAALALSEGLRAQELGLIGGNRDASGGE